MTTLLTLNPTEKFEQQLVQSMPKLRRLAFSLTSSNTDSDDLVQHTLQRAMEKRTQCRDKNNIDSWLISILRSIWKNELRSRQTRRGNGTIDVIELTDSTIQHHPEKTCSRAQLRNRVNALPDDFRSVVILVDYYGLSYKETADMLDIKLGTVMSRLARARQTLMNISVSL